MRDLRTQNRCRRLSRSVVVASLSLWSMALTGACSTAPSGSPSSGSAGTGAIDETDAGRGGARPDGAVSGAGGSEIDAGMGDDGTMDPPCDPGDGGISISTTAPDKLSATGLYTDIATQTFLEEALEFEPVRPLWSDGATKRRFVYLPK